MKQIKNFLIVAILLVLLLFATGCGINQNLGASMLQTNEIEEPASEEEPAADVDVVEDSDVLEEQQLDQPEEDQIEEDQIVDDRVVTVILNTNKDRKRIHLENRSCTNKINAENRQVWTGTADELIDYAREHGYVACGSCHPEKELDIDLPTNK